MSLSLTIVIEQRRLPPSLSTMGKMKILLGPDSCRLWPRHQPQPRIRAYPQTNTNANSTQIGYVQGRFRR